MGICFVFCAYLSSAVGGIFAQANWLTLVGLTETVKSISRIPYGFFYCPKPGIVFFCTYYALILIIFNYKRWRLTAAKVYILVLTIANIFVWKPLFAKPTDMLRVTFFDVGHGDAIFVEFPNKGNMLIDGGPGGEDDAGRWVILPFLWNKGITQIDAIVLTHPDNDHVGGLKSVFKNVKVNYVFDNGIMGDCISYKNYETAKENIPYYFVTKKGDEITGFGNAKLLVVHPPEKHLSTNPAETNNDSIVLKLVYEDISFILCADIQKQAIASLLPLGETLQSEVIKVPHHGSDEGKQLSYLFRTVSAKVAIISAMNDNRFGFASPRVIKSLQQLGAEVYVTGESGAISISTDGQKLWVATTVR